MEADGSGLEQLTGDPADDRNPVWSPDGRTIAFSSDRTGSGDIYVMDADGSNVRQVTDHPTYEGAPRFSPDGSLLVFEGERDGRAEIYRVSLKEGVVERVTDSMTRKLGPAFSPDGAELAYMEKTIVWWQVTVSDWQRGTRRRVTGGGGSCRPAWSPDGSLLAFVSTRGTDKADVWFREMRGSREGNAWRVMTRPGAYNYDPAFSPDGTALATASTVVRGPNEDWDLFVSDLNGRNLVQLTGGEGNERFPDWRPVAADE
jgi:TolB protein